MPPAAADEQESARDRRRWRRVRSVLIAAVVLAGLGVVLVQQLELSRPGSSPVVERRARAAGKPPIVVRPFEDLGGGEPASGDLARTLREELLLLLDDPELFVVATHGSDPAGDDAAGYVLRGSVRVTADQVRITARLSGPDAGRQIWSDAYDEPLASLREPAGQRALARRIATVAAPYGPIFESEIERVRAVPAAELQSSDCALKYYEFRRVLDRVRHADALACFELATAREPESVEAWAGLSLLSAEQYAHGYVGQGAPSPLDNAREAARRALDIDGDNFHANLALAGVQFFGGEDFHPVAERVLRTWPERGEAQAFLGGFFILSGDTARGRSLVESALASTAHPPSGYHATRALAALREEDIDEALAWALRIDSPDWPLGHVIVAAIAALAGRGDLAARSRSLALALDPTIEAVHPEVLRRWRVEPVLAAALERGFAEAGRF
jgi:TolB-like protein